MTQVGESGLFGHLYPQVVTAKSNSRRAFRLASMASRRLLLLAERSSAVLPVSESVSTADVEVPGSLLPGRKRLRVAQDSDSSDEEFEVVSAVKFPKSGEISEVPQEDEVIYVKTRRYVRPPQVQTFLTHWLVPVVSAKACVVCE